MVTVLVDEGSKIFNGRHLFHSLVVNLKDRLSWCLGDTTTLVLATFMCTILCAMFNAEVHHILEMWEAVGDHDRIVGESNIINEGAVDFNNRRNSTVKPIKFT